MKDQNENRSGYKKTKMGWIPEEWNCVKAEFLSRRITVGIVVKPARWYSNQGIRAFRSLNVARTRVLDNNWVYITKEGHGLNKKSSVRSGDLLIVRSGEPGICCVVPPEFDGCNCIDLIILTPKSEIAHASFLCEFVNSSYGRGQVLKQQAGLAQKHFNVKECRSLYCTLPPLVEQKKIAEILSTWDEASEKMRKLIDAKKRLKKALMRQLLMGKKRLTGFGKSADRRYYRFFDLPEDWGCPRIREIATERSIRNKNSDEVTVLACSKYFGFIESSQYFGKKVFSEDTSNYKVIQRGWFGYPSNHIEEGSIGLLVEHDIGIVSPIYTVFQCNDLIIPEYLFAVFKTDTFRHIFSISTNASVDRRGSLRWKEFSLINVALPTLDEQRAIVDVLETAEKEITLFVKEQKALEKQKQGLMQKLLTGEIRVNL